MLYPQRHLLRVRALIILLAGEENGSGWQWTTVGDGKSAKLRQIVGSDTGICAGGRRSAQDLSLREQRLVNSRRVQRWVARSSQNSNEGVRDLAGVIDVAEGLHDVGDLRIDGRIEDSVAAANDSLVLAKRVPGKGDSGREIVFIGI